jgi:HupE/UreJ protein
LRKIGSLAGGISPLSDLDLVLGLDADRNRKVSPDELGQRFSDVEAYVLKYLQLRVAGAPQPIFVTNSILTVEEFPDGASTKLDFIITNLAHPRALEVEYRFMFEFKPLDRGLIQIECRGVTHSGVFTADRPVQSFDLEKPRSGREFLAFVRHGVWHIWIGLDHILFLMALLLPAVLKFEENHWHAVTGFHEAFFNVFKVVTAFTLAHSLTLSLTALQIVSLPSRWVEAAIAASVLLAAANNLRAFFPGRLWLVAFGFGLVHGFGFASVLTELGLPSKALLVALLGFNLGVEIGQLAIVSLFLPLAYSLRRSRFYQGIVMKLGSGLIALLAGAWLLQRVFDWKILPV